MRIVETTTHYCPDLQPNTKKELHFLPILRKRTIHYPFDQKLTIIKNPPSFSATYLYNGEVRTRESSDGWTINSVDFITRNPNVKKIVYLYNP